MWRARLIFAGAFHHCRSRGLDKKEHLQVTRSERFSLMVERKKRNRPAAGVFGCQNAFIGEAVQKCAQTDRCEMNRGQSHAVKHRPLFFLFFQVADGMFSCCR